jgi:transcriptional regulator with XRE-family HTH domain
MKLQEAQEAVERIGAEEIPRFLRSWRKRLRLNELDFAKLSGIPQSNIHRIEHGKQGVTPRTFARVMNGIEKRIRELEKENSILRGIADASYYVGLCSKLPWMKSQLPVAKAMLAEKEAKAAKLPDKDSLSDPIVRGLLDSLYREIGVLENATNAIPTIYGQLAGDASMKAIDAFQRGEKWAVDAYEHWIKTGEAPTVKIDSIEEVGEENS